MHACPVKGCRETLVPDNKLMCRRHWRHAPFSLGEAVVNAWRDMRRTTKRRNATAAEQLAALRQYVKAKDAAVAFVEQLEAKR